jgi:hypothetical protein
MAMPVLTRDEVEDMVMEALNVSKVTYGTHDGSPLYKNENIREHIFQADLDVVKAITRSPGHPRRDEYSTGFSIATPGVVVRLSDTNHHVGEVIYVSITRNDAKVVTGKTAPAQKITEWLIDKASYGGDDCVDGYYDVTDNNFIFTGLSAAVRALNVAPHILNPPDTNLYSPFEYKLTVFRLAMKELLKKDPEMATQYNQYAEDADKDMMVILGNDAKMYPSVQDAHGRR